MKPPTVTVAYLHPNEVAQSFHHALIAMIMHDASTSRMLMHTNGQKAIRCGTDGIVQARNLAVKEFLESDVEWLFWLDSDMGFEPNVLQKLMGAAHETERPIIGGLCFANWEVGADGMLGHRTIPRPTIYADADGRYRGVEWFPVNKLVRTAATGSACVLIHRSVLEKVKAKFGEVWYDRITSKHSVLLGEDVSFCERATACGVPLFVHTGARTNHAKTSWISEMDFWSRAPVPPAAERTTVIVPVLDRPQNAAPFMRSLRASTGLVDVIAVANVDGDEGTAQAWADEGAFVVRSERKSFACKVNEAMRHVGAGREWVFLAGDDVHFHPGWLDHLQWVAGMDNAKVVGSNDLGNPAVLAGEHATHMLISTAYIRESGSSWDGPGVVTHEGHRHNFVDNEIVAAARQRGVWSMALGSLVEHLHPAWGRGEADETYRVGQLTFERDQRLFNERYYEHVNGVASPQGVKLRKALSLA